jgi:uncharacterized protein (DUF1810 family)
MSDSFDLRRFAVAQAAVYPQVVAELSHGRKQTQSSGATATIELILTTVPALRATKAGTIA